MYVHDNLFRCGVGGRANVLVGIAGDEPLLERLRVLVSEPTTDSHVKRKAVELFGSWSVNFRNEKGMERLAGLRSQTMPTKVHCQVNAVDRRNELHQLFDHRHPRTILSVRGKRVLNGKCLLPRHPLGPSNLPQNQNRIRNPSRKTAPDQRRRISPSTSIKNVRLSSKQLRPQTKMQQT